MSVSDHRKRRRRPRAAENRGIASLRQSYASPESLRGKSSPRAPGLQRQIIVRALELDKQRVEDLSELFGMHRATLYPRVGAVIVASPACRALLSRQPETVHTDIESVSKSMGILDGLEHEGLYGTLDPRDASRKHLAVLLKPPGIKNMKHDRTNWHSALGINAWDDGYHAIRLGSARAAVADAIVAVVKNDPDIFLPPSLVLGVGELKPTS